MIDPKSLCEIIASQKYIPFVRIEDMTSHCLYEFEDEAENVNAENVSLLVAEKLKTFANYGTVKVKMGTAAHCKAYYRGANQYTVKVSEVKTTGAVSVLPANDPISNMKNTLEVVALFNGMMGNRGNSDIEIRLKELELKNAYDQRVRELEKENENPIFKWAAGIPVVLTALGKKPEEVSLIMKSMADSHMMFNPSAPGRRMAGTNILETDKVILKTDEPSTFQELDKLSVDEKNEMIQDLLDAMVSKMSGQEMIMMLQTLFLKPEIAPAYLKLFHLSQKVEIVVLEKLLDGLNEKPEYCKMALNFVNKK